MVINVLFYTQKKQTKFSKQNFQSKTTLIFTKYIDNDLYVAVELSKKKKILSIFYTLM